MKSRYLKTALFFCIAFFSISSLATSVTFPKYKTVMIHPDFQGEEEGRSKFFKSQKIFYLKDGETSGFKLTLKDGLIYDVKGNLFDTNSKPAIFVMASDGTLYSSKIHAVGVFHHSSLLAGAPVAGAGEIVVKNGVLMSINNRSGHYRPSGTIHQQVIARLAQDGVIPRHSRTISQSVLDQFLVQLAKNSKHNKNYFSREVFQKMLRTKIEEFPTKNKTFCLKEKIELSRKRKAQDFFLKPWAFFNPLSLLG